MSSRGIGVGTGAHRCCSASAVATGLAVAVLCGCPSDDGDEERVGAAPPATALYDDFSSGALSHARWQPGQSAARIGEGTAALRQAVTAAQANLTSNTALIVRPPSGGQVTTLQADVVLDELAVSGTTRARAAIDLQWQPAADRVVGPFNTDRMLIARVLLDQGPGFGGQLVARHTVLLCRAGGADCSQSAALSATAGNWTGGVPVVVGTTYTMSITVDPAARTFTFGISGGTLGARTGTVDVSPITDPFTPDLSATNFLRARLLTQVGGGLNETGATGDGAVAARFDNVRVGVGGAAATLFDDFSAGTGFDPARWTVGGHGTRVADGALEIGLEQRDSPAVAGVSLRDTAASALQAQVTVTQHTAAGAGRISAQLVRSLYNDGAAGTAAPDVSGPRSQVGDLQAAIGMTGTEVFYQVIRCDTALCSGFTHVQPPTRIATVTPGSTHTLYVNWDSAERLAVFQLDGGKPVSFDPVAAGHPVTSASPSVPVKRVGVRADSAGPGAPFAAGSSGSITAVFDDVKTN